MKYLMDVNALLAAIIQNHPKHAVVDGWVRGKNLAVSPLSELGFLRIGTHPSAYNLSMAIAWHALQNFITTTRAQFIPADLSALRASAARSADVTDSYMAQLAAQHNLRLATLDEAIKHPAVEVIR